MNDLISREAVGYYIQSYIHEIITESGTDKNEHTNSILRAILNGIKTMPSVQPTRPTEQWQELKETITEMCDNGGTGTQQEVCKFLTNYMEILEKQMQQPCEDCISRKQALKKTKALIRGDYDPEYIIKALKMLPSVTPNAKTGKWIDIGNEGLVFKCSLCGDKNTIESHYCPNCGARMEEAEE